MKYLGKSFSVGGHSAAYSSNFDAAFGRKLDVDDGTEGDSIQRMSQAARDMIVVCQYCGTVIAKDEVHATHVDPRPGEITQCVTRKRGE